MDSFNGALTQSVIGRPLPIGFTTHSHGRAKRALMNISEEDIKDAIKYGNVRPVKEGRLKYTFNGIVCITDGTSCHEVTSYRE
mmetsp:Transcript_27502/g.27725  ORF Transcript_27502/g.27725 Transcript_27502/m.27725 type:complete len:83 (-) Transcript_27502:153-401(-)|eukprot:CAMPEP_0182430222 /NCGR_PEP_ID=MMETSP1167-20130531/38510_1 /TAXON_ID=2988 /ORGANISM="Mallomonas Sp, Strain CCMP3275" /LENGTH=82 /DNA_ID=CAMNT_0024615087 /DNA_START=52 /DNA_END=300 /DNA_ORIENTATION=+